MDRIPSQIPAACCCPQGSLPRQVHRGSPTGFRKRKARLLRHAEAAWTPEGVRRANSADISQRLGRLLQASVRRSRARSTVPRLLYAPSRHLQSPARRSGRRQSHLSLEGLSPQEQKAADDHPSGRVPPPLSPACTTDEVRSHSALRYSQHAASVCSASAVPTAHCGEPAAARAARCTTEACRQVRRAVAMPTLRWTDAVTRTAFSSTAAAPLSTLHIQCGPRMKSQLHRRPRTSVQQRHHSCAPACLRSSRQPCPDRPTSEIAHSMRSHPAVRKTTSPLKTRTVQPT